MITLYKSILAGMLICMGCIANLVISNHYIGSFIFSLGLYTIIVLQYELFTGKVGYICVQNNKLKYICYLIKVWIGNLIGCALVGSCVSYSRLNIPINHIIEIKLSDNFISLTILGVLCGILMAIAVEGYKHSKNPLIVIMPVMTFILCGYEHCIADMGYLFIMNNWNLNTLLIILVVTIGNTIGGNLICLLSNQKEK